MLLVVELYGSRSKSLIYSKIMSSTIGALALADSAAPTVKIHPTAVIGILSSHMRRSNKSGRVIGTLLGTVSGNNIEVTDCFGFPHLENIVDGKPSVSLDMAYANSRYALHRRVNKTEQVVGWYATTGTDGAFITDFSALIHECYTAQCVNPVHIVVDTNLSGDSIDVRGFVSSALVVDGRVLASIFDDVAVTLAMSESEASCINLITQHEKAASPQDRWSKPTIVADMPTSRDQLVQSLDSVVDSLDRLSSYIEDVVVGRREGSDSVAEAIEHTLGALNQPQTTAVLDSIVGRQHDLTMAGYLATLVQTQVNIADRLQSIL